MFFDKLDRWQRATGINDVALGRMVGCAHTTIARAKRGKQFLKPELKAAIRDATRHEVGFEDWAKFEERAVAARKDDRPQSAA